MPFSPLLLLAMIFCFIMLVAFLQIGMLTIAFDKLGLSPGSAITLLIMSLLGSAINLPLFKVEAETPPPDLAPPRIRSLLKQFAPPFTGITTIAINVGGGLIPVAFSLYLIIQNLLPLLETLLAISIVAGISYYFSRPISGLGIGMPVLIAPLAAAIVALLLAPEHSAPLAYICGTLGVLIGADLFRLREIKRMGVSVAAIGGAGTFDGIFITGIVAVILA